MFVMKGDQMMKCTYALVFFPPALIIMHLWNGLMLNQTELLILGLSPDIC